MRARKGRGALRGCLLLLLVPHIWCGALLPLMGLYQLAELVRFHTFGYVREGRVQRLRTERGKGGPYYRVEYTFELPTGMGTGEATVDEAAFSRLAVGDIVNVRFLPGFRAGPQLLADGARSPASDLWKIWLFIVFWDGAMLVLVWPGVVRPLRQRSLVRHGVAVPGRITDKYETKNQRPKGYRVRYSYSAPAPGPSGEDMEYQRVMYIREEDYNRVRAEDRVIVLYDWRKPRRSLVYECADYEAR
jgi:hypothetical protein